MPPQKRRKTTKTPLVVALDLDHTLIAYQKISLNVPPTQRVVDDMFILDVPEYKQRFLIRKRPGLDAFLRHLKNQEGVRIVLFTASVKEYASKVIDRLDPTHTIFEKCLYQSDCTPIDKKFGEQHAKFATAKCLKVIDDAPLRRIVLVDDNVLSFLHQPDNGILIPKFYIDTDIKKDDELSTVLTIIRDLAKADGDVRPILRERFNNSQLFERAVEAENNQTWWQ